MRVACAQIHRFARALVAQAAVFWLTLAPLGPGMVSDRTWLALHALLAFTLVAIQSAPAAARVVSARTWVAVAFYSAFFAACFAGANFALDALHGAHRPKADMAAFWGGLELWQFLFPGVFSLALGALVASQVASRGASHPQ